MLVELMPAGVVPASVDEVKAFLRLEHHDEDAVVAGFVRAATALAEAFTGQWLVARDFTESVAASAGWQRLGVAPVTAITTVGIGSFALPTSAYEIDIDRAGAGWVRLLTGDATLKASVSGRAGLGEGWNGVPEPLRAGIVRLAAHLFTHRDDPDASALPVAVGALWRPWRMVRI
ncbi:phage head-tail connector protein [Sphingosinicellaceae bacterium]|nr:phage head-tail connector protein [Sphingosinicellaceae bacterium]